MRSRSVASLGLIGLLACTLGVGLPAPVADACGGFYSVRVLAPEKRPSLAREKVLIVHDAARGREHFIREVAFRKADQRLGFVVPTPTLPEVAKVEKNPFTKLRERFQFASDAVGYGSGHGSAGFGGRGGGETVEVLKVEKVGSFTAFTLRATEAEALKKWLADNELTSRPAADVWLEHYVRMRFYYVALRYDPPPDARGRKYAPVAAETVRISFDTPVAYYPYFEPEIEHETREPRLLEVWYVGTDAVVPVAQQLDAAESPARPRWVRPLRPGKKDPRARTRLVAALLDELEALLPEGELVVQTFQDQKRRRTGFGDILFAFAEAKPLTAEQLGPLVGVLDPGLVAAGAADPVAAPAPEVK